MENNIEVKITDSPQKVAKRISKAIVNMIQNSGNERFDIAISGGKTPDILFDRIARKSADKIDWSRIHFWWADERCVSPDSPDSNYGKVYESLLSKISIPTENIHRIKGESVPEQEALRYSEEIRKNLNFRGDWPVFDLILLGMGDDGHTASIFPDQLDLLESTEICKVAVHPVTGQKRLTLTGKVLNNANVVIFMVTGITKAKRVSEIMNNDANAKKLPAFYIIPEHGKLTWYLDSEAGSDI